MSRITREQKIEQSAQDYARLKLITERGYPDDRIEFADRFDPERLNREGLTKNVIAAGFNFDDGGRSTEMGSNMVSRLYTIEFYVVGVTYVWGSNLSGALQEALDEEGRIPIFDLDDPAKPIMDYLLVDDVAGVQRSREPVANPTAWQENLWSVRLRAVDEYYRALV